MSNNYLILIGRLGADPKIIKLENGQSIAQFSLAVSDIWIQDGKKQEYTNWFTVKAYGRRAEVIATYLKKGSRILVQGKLHSKAYQKEGKNKRATYMNAQDIQFLDMIKSNEVDAKTNTTAANDALDNSPLDAA